LARTILGEKVFYSSKVPGFRHIKGTYLTYDPLLQVCVEIYKKHRRSL